MRPLPLNDNLADKSSQGGGRTEAAAIHAEIATRVLIQAELEGDKIACGFAEKYSTSKGYEKWNADKPIRKKIETNQTELIQHLAELRETIGEREAALFYKKARVVWTLYPPAFFMLMHLMTGNLSEVTTSYTQIGKADCRTKQAVQQEWERILSTIKPHYPELAEALIHIRSISAKLSEPGP